MIYIMLNTVLMFITSSFALVVLGEYGLPKVLVAIFAFISGFCIMAFYYMPSILKLKREWDEKLNRKSDK